MGQGALARRLGARAAGGDGAWAIFAELAAAVRPLAFAPPVACVYRPLDYAAAPARAYARRYGAGPVEVLLVGMNPGPWGMAQTGVPFGAVPAVRDWLGIDAPVLQPAPVHPQRPVDGLACRRVEVSGARLWAWAEGVWGTPAQFFDQCFVTNYCPLSFMEAGGRNRTPDQLPARERAPLFAACDLALARLAAHLRPRIVVGIGAFAAARAQVAAQAQGCSHGQILHPSPASPRANRGWAAQASAELAALGVSLPG